MIEEVRLEEAEIEYLRDLVAEAWFYKRPTSFPANKQEELWKLLDTELKNLQKPFRTREGTD